MISLAEALLLPDWEVVTMLAGPTDSHSTLLSGAVVLPDLRAEIPAGADGALLAVPNTLDRGDWLLDVLMRRAVAAGCAALLVGGKTVVGRASATVARRLGLPILGAEDPMAVSVALRVHLTLPELAAARWVTLTAQACADAKATLEGVLSGVATSLRRSVWLLDSGGNPVAGRAYDHDKPPVSDETTAEGTARWLQGPVDPDAEWVHLEVTTDHPRGAYLALRRTPDDPDQAVMAALQILSVAVAGRLAMQRLTAERDARQRMSLMSELIQSGGHLADQTPRRMLDHGWRLDGHHVGIRIDVPSALDPVALRPEVLRAFADAEVAAQVVEHGDGWVAWSTFADELTSEQLRAHGAAVRRVQWILRSHLPTVMGVGSLQQGPDGLMRSLGEAGDAARIAATRAASGHLVHVDRLGLSQLLLAWTRTDTFAPAAASLLTPLQGTSGLLETLAAYLESESSVADTAAVLGLHRNTVTTRIARAVKLLGVNLEEPDERLAVQLACRSVQSRA